MLEVGILKNFDSGTYKAGVQFAGSLTTYFDDVSVAKNIPSSALVIGNYVIVAIPGGNPRDACVIATWPGGSPGANKLNDIGDVSVATPADDDLFYYDNATGLWKSRKLVDADIPAGIARDAEVVVAVAAEAAARDAAIAAIVLGDLNNVYVPTPPDGYVLYWDDANSLWKCKSALAPTKSRAYRNGDWWMASGGWIRVPLNAASFDSNSELDVTSKLGTADATEANKLHDADGGFTTADVGKWLYNSTDYTYTQVTGFVDSGELDLAADIMASGEGYELYAGTFTATKAGYYPVVGVVRCNWTLADKWYFAGVAKNGTYMGTGGFQSSVGDGVATNCISGIATDLVYLDVGDELSLMAYHNEGNPAQFRGETSQTYLAVHGPV